LKSEIDQYQFNCNLFLFFNLKYKKHKDMSISI